MLETRALSTKDASCTCDADGDMRGFVDMLGHGMVTVCCGDAEHGDMRGFVDICWDMGW